MLPNYKRPNSPRSSNAFVMVNGALWIASDNFYGGYAPAGFVSFDAFLQYFQSFNLSSLITGGIGVNATTDMVTPYGPQFGIIYMPGYALNFGLNFGFLYLAPAIAANARTCLLQSLQGLHLGPNVNPLLTEAQIAQHKLNYVAISLDSSQTPLSASSARIDFTPSLTINLVPFGA